MATDTHMIGSNFEAHGLIDAARNIVQRVEEASSAFSRYNLGAAWKKSVGALVAKIEPALADRETAAGDALPTRGPVTDALALAKDWRGGRTSASRATTW